MTKTEKITILKKLRDVWFGKFVMRWYKTIREVISVNHAKTPGLDQVPKLNYGQKSPNLTKSIEKPCEKKGFCLFIAQK